MNELIQSAPVLKFLSLSRVDRMDWFSDLAAPASNGSVEKPTNRVVAASYLEPAQVGLIQALNLDPIVCPGTSDSCMLETTRLYKVSRRVSDRARRRLTKALRKFHKKLDRIARKEGRGRLPLQVEVHLTSEGPELAFGIRHGTGGH